MGKQKAPTDHLTGIPLLFVPHMDAKELMKGAFKARPFSDWNHSFFPRTSPELKELAGLAVRYCRVQKVLRAEHDAYHNEWFGPPSLPQTEEEKFRIAVLCAAGFIPPAAINMGRSKPRQETLNFRQIRRLRTSGEVTVGRTNKVRKFLRSYVIDREVDFADKKLVSDFLCTSQDTEFDCRHKADLARQLLSLTVQGVDDHLRAGYCFGYDNDLLYPTAPKNPSEFLVEELSGPTITTIWPVIKLLTARLA